MTANEQVATTAAHKSELGCHVCRKNDIAGVCHHCGLPFCAEHLPAASRPWYYIDREYYGLGLPKADEGETAVHCIRHRHERFSWRPFYRSAALFAVAILVPMFYVYQRDIRLPALLVYLLAVSLGILIPGWFADVVGDHGNEPPLPLSGRGPSVKLREFVSGTVHLWRDGLYEPYITKQYGLIEFQLAPHGSEDKIRKALLRRYHLRHSRLDRTHMGFLALQGKANVAIQGSEMAALERRPHVLALEQAAEDHPFFPLDGAAQPYLLKPRYQFHLDGGLPVRLLPALVSTDRSLGLELTVQLQTKPPQLMRGADVVVQELTLCVEPELAPVQGHWPAAVSPDPEYRCSETDHVPVVTWKDIGLLPDSEAPVKASSPGYHRAFFVRFDRAAPLWRSNVSGSLQLRIDNRLLSGLSGAVFFSPLGRRRDDLACTMHTEIRLNFTLSLNSLVVVQPYGVDTVRQYPGPAGLEKVLELADRLSARGYYVKQLVEHTRGVLHREQAHEVDRTWTMAGRYYRGVYPVNFEVEVSCPASAQHPGSPEVAVLKIRLEARVSRGPTYNLLGGTQTSLLRICDEVFGRTPPVGAPVVRPTTRAAQHATGAVQFTPRDSGTGPTPGAPGYSHPLPGRGEQP